MVSNKDGSLLALLKEMLKCCNDVQEALRNDKNFFVKNDIASIEKSNFKKTELLEKLNFLSSKINSQDSAKTFFNKIEQEVEKSAPEAQEELTSLAEKLKAEVTACYNCIMINSTIVFSNLQQIKGLWDKFASCNLSNNCVYDRKGAIK